MDKQKQIEEIQGLMVCQKWGQYCIECDKECHECISERIYNAGYRKIPENAVVLTREEYDDLTGGE